MKISVIIPAYNAESVLKDALTSILNQTYLNYITEIIIIDDGSSDHTAQIMENIKNELHKIEVVLLHQKNAGASAARNAGLKIAKGDWIALLDADDEWLPNKLEVQIKTLKEHPEIDFLGCQSDDRPFKILNRTITTLYKATIKDLCIKSFPVTPAILFRKSILEDIGYFDEDRKYMEDAEFCLRVCEKYNYYQLPDSLVRTGHGKASIGVSGLSANLQGMQKGYVQNLYELRKRHVISLPFYYRMRIFYALKYVRRILFMKLRK